MNIQFLYGDKARIIIYKLHDTIIGYESTVERWLNEQNKVRCYLLYQDNKLKSLALLSECNFDPLKEYKYPYILDLIYTYESFRNNGYCTHLINHMKKNNEMTAFCDNSISSNLLKKLKFRYVENDDYPQVDMYRFP